MAGERDCAACGEGADKASFRPLTDGATIGVGAACLGTSEEVDGAAGVDDTGGEEEATAVTMICSPRVIGIEDKKSPPSGRGFGGYPYFTTHYQLLLAYFVEPSNRLTFLFVWRNLRCGKNQHP